MNAFGEYYKTYIFKEPVAMRLTQLDFLINDVIARMSETLSPTAWNELLQQKELLEIERENLASSIIPPSYV